MKNLKKPILIIKALKILIKNPNMFLKKIGVILNKRKILKLQEGKSSDIPLDLIIPSLEKDIKVLPLCIQGVKKHLKHPLKKIYIISPKNSLKIIEFCKENDYEFVDEDTVLPFKVSEIEVKNRKGWIFQQFLKLNGSIGESKNFLVIDSDTILIKDFIFTSEEKVPIFLERKTKIYPSTIRMLKNLLKIEAQDFPSYIAHKMVFNKEKLQEMKNEIEKNTHKIWYKAITDEINKIEEKNPDIDLSFSEFDFYVKWYQDRYLYQTFPFIDVKPKKFINNLEELEKKYSKKCKDISYHHYLEIK